MIVDVYALELKLIDRNHFYLPINFLQH